MKLNFEEYREILFEKLLDEDYHEKLLGFINKLSKEEYSKKEICELFIVFHREIQIDPRTKDNEQVYDNLSDFMDGLSEWGKGWRILPDEPQVRRELLNTHDSILTTKIK
jgi:hypothetical protein